MTRSLEPATLDVTAEESAPQADEQAAGVFPLPTCSEKAACKDSPRKLIKRAAGGCPKAQRELISTFEDTWFRFCLSMLSDFDLARDATQETALRFLMTLKRFKFGSTLRTWSLGIALNVCREMRRKQLKSRGADCEENPSVCPQPPPDASAEHAELLRKMTELVEKLPNRQREVVTLRYFHHLSVNETANTLGIAPGTVKATLSQTLDKLRLKMEHQHV